MTDPLSVTASIVGIAVPALHASRLLLDDLRQIKDAPSTIRTLAEKIDSLNTALTAVESIGESEWESLGPGVVQNARSTIASTAAACERFSADVHRWTSRSKDGSLSWIDRSKIGFFKQSQLASMNAEIQACYTKLISVVSIATLLKSIQQGHITDEIKHSLNCKQGELVKTSHDAETECGEIERNLQMFSISEAPRETDLQDYLKQLKEQQRNLKESQILLTDLIATLQETRRKTGMQPDQSIHVTFGDNNKGIQLGVSYANINFSSLSR